MVGKTPFSRAATRSRVRALSLHRAALRMGGRVVEGTGLENRQAGNRLVGSNPTPSAIDVQQVSVLKWLF